MVSTDWPSTLTLAGAERSDRSASVGVSIPAFWNFTWSLLGLRTSNEALVDTRA